MKISRFKIKFVLMVAFILGFDHSVISQIKESAYSFENSAVTYPSGCVTNRTLILAPTGNSFAKDRVYNPTVIASKDSLYMIYRAEGVGTHHGVFGLASSKDGKNFDQYKNNPIMISTNGEIGVEDPRVVKYGETFYLFYIANLGDRASIQIATSSNLKDWTKQGEIFDRKYNWQKKQVKSPTPINQKLNNKFWCYHLGEIKAWEPKIGLAYSEDLKTWTQIEKPVIEPRKKHFDSQGTEPEVAVLIEQGIFMLYAGWGGDGTNLNKMGWVLFDKTDPSKVLKRCEKPLIALSDGHIFGEGLEYYNGEWKLYYGVRDQWIEGVTIDIDKLCK